MAVAATPFGMELASPPTDGITSLSFCPSGNPSQADLLLASSWDRGVKIYSVSSNTLRYSIDHEAPVLDACFTSEGTEVCSAGLDKLVKRHVVSTEPKGGGADVVGSHDAPVKCLSYVRESDLLVSGSWDKTVRAWDPRVPTGGSAGPKPVAKLPLPAKVFSLDSHGHRVVVAMAQRKVSVYDTRKLDPKHAEIERDSILKYQIRSVRCMPSGLGYACSSVEGRVSMEYFAEGEGRKSYAFKCHRVTKNATEVVYPVNCLAFHPKFGTFATGGCDGSVQTWDGERKKRLHKFPSYATSVAALSFNSQGTNLAVAASYTWEQGEKDHPLDAIFVRDVNDSEVKKG